MFNFKNNQNTLYPKKEKLNKLFDEFNINNYNNNLEINHKLKRNPNQIVRDKLLSKKTDIVIKKVNPEFEELSEIAKKIQEIKNDIKNIKEKQTNYRASSMIDKNYMEDEFNNIKTNTIKINSDVEGLKDEIKDYNNKYIQIINNIDNHHNKYLILKKGMMT